MKVIPIDSKSITPIDYSHLHDSKLLFTKYTESFDFGLTVNQYYFNQNPKDKKTNFNTQYTLTDLYPLSTIAELDIPYTATTVRSFSTTIKHNDKYLKNIYTNQTDTVSSVSSTFVDASEYNAVSSQFVYTFSVSSVAVSGVENYDETEDRLSISQEYNSLTYYLTAATTPSTESWWTTAGPSYFRYAINNNKIVITNPIGTSRLCNNGDILTLSANSNFTTAAHLSTGFFDISRNILTKDFKYIPNSYSKYVSSFNPDTVDLNTSTTVAHISNNYFVYNNNYNFFQENKNNKFMAHADLFPLKNQATIDEYYAENNHFNAQPSYLNRVYEKIHSGINQIRGHSHIGLSYNIGTYDIEFKPNKLTYFTTPNSMAPYTVLNIKDSKIHNLGAVPGDNPLMADKVFKRREVAKNNTFSDDINPIYLCSWLSGGIDGSTRWVDRYYNPLVSDFSSALSGTSYYKVVTAAGAETTETFDVSSSLTFEPNNDYIFYHVGDKDYEKLFEAYTTYNAATGVQYTNHKGVPVTVKKSKADDNIKLDGNTLGKFNANITGDFSVNFWLNTNDYTLPFCYQLLGNYFEDGFGVFNTDLVTPNIILPAESKPNSRVYSKLLFLNNDFEIYDEIILKDGVDEVGIKGIGRRDNFSQFFVLGDNNVIYVFDNNNNLISKIEDLKDTAKENAVIDDFEVSSSKIHVLFNPVHAKNYFTYNTDTNKSSTTTSSPSAKTTGTIGKIFNRNNNVTILSADNLNGFGNEVAFDSSDTPFIVRQFYPSNTGANRNFIQKGVKTDLTDLTERIESGLDKKARIQGLVIDDEDQLVVLHDNNVISLLDNNRKFIKAKEFCDLQNLSIEQTYLDLIYDFEDGVYKKYILLLQEFINGVRLTKVDFDLNIVFSKKLRGINIGSLKLTKTITSYNYLQKTGASKNKIKAVIKTKPKFSSTGTFARKKTEISFDTSQLNPGWNHFFINVSTTKGYMCMFVNGKLFSKVGFSSGKYALDKIIGTGCYIGAISTPYYLTLANKLLQPKKYFVKNAAIKGFKLYNKTMDYFDIMAHYNYHLKDKSVIWSYPIGQRTYIDTIDKLMKFNYPEKISNKYQLEIKNTGIKDSLLTEKIKDRVKKELEKITPYYDEVKDIIIS